MSFIRISLSPSGHVVVARLNRFLLSTSGDNFNKVETLRVAQSDKQSFTVLPVFVLPSSRRLL